MGRRLILRCYFPIDRPRIPINVDQSLIIIILVNEKWSQNIKHPPLLLTYWEYVPTNYHVCYKQAIWTHPDTMGGGLHYRISEYYDARHQMRCVVRALRLTTPNKMGLTRGYRFGVRRRKPILFGLVRHISLTKRVIWHCVS